MFRCVTLFFAGVKGPEALCITPCAHTVGQLHHLLEETRAHPCFIAPRSFNWAFEISHTKHMLRNDTIFIVHDEKIMAMTKMMMITITKITTTTVMLIKIIMIIIIIMILLLLL